LMGNLNYDINELEYIPDELIPVKIWLELIKYYDINFLEHILDNVKDQELYLELVKKMV